MDCNDEDISALIGSRAFPDLKNDRVLKVAWGFIPDRLPIWIMRQAGRYLPEFQEMRKQYGFFEICENPKLACEVTLMPLKRYDLDAAIIFSDILVVPRALGMECIMEKSKGPVFPNPLTPENLNTLNFDDALLHLKYVGDAITLTRHKLQGKVPLIGFSAAPWTLMVYMVEGQGTKTASVAKRWLYTHNDESQYLLSNLTSVIIEYLVMQVVHGAQLLQIFESCAEHLTYSMYSEKVACFVTSIRNGVAQKLQKLNISQVPIIFFAKGGYHLLNIQLGFAFDVLSLDWAADPIHVRRMCKNIVLQGNLDPCALYLEKDQLVGKVKEMIREFGFARYIVNLGHGIYPDTNPEAVNWLIEIVHSFKPTTGLERTQGLKIFRGTMNERFN